ncbi:MAG: acyl-ACP--UDP-N-acetylglucosamine O-acyltransferase [Cytophagales bacterium]|nr:acyl-ACP--UDP-N-acetylglucosamine O-acyltransferase [Cytophagales bacterium]
MKQPLANIHPDAKIADSAIIEPFATVSEDVEIGEGSWIGPNACIWNGARIGSNCKIYSGAQISCEPQDLKYKGEKTTAHIGDNSIVREFVTVSRGTDDKYDTKIGANCLLMAYAHVAHDCDLGKHCIIGNAVQVAGHVIIEDYAIISGTSAVHQFVKVGAHVMISGGSLIRKDVPPFIKAGREPLSYAGINSVGLRRWEFSGDVINDIQNAYRYIYQSDLNNSKALEKIKRSISSNSAIDQIVEFVEKSERGIIRGFSDSI